MTTMSIRDVSLNVEVVGHGYPLVLMHGGPSADLWSLWPFRAYADQFTLVVRSRGRRRRSSPLGICSKGWTVMDRLGEIAVPALVMAGRQDFVFPPEAQAELAGGIPGARLHIVERAGHNPDEERTAEVMQAVRDFISAEGLTRMPPPRLQPRGSKGGATPRSAQRSRDR